MNTVFREAVEEDLEAVHAMDRQISPVFGSADAYRHLLDQAGLILLALGQKGLCGFAALSTVLDEATLLNLAVQPEARRSGVGRRLLEQSTDRLRSRGVRRLLLEVRESNLGAQALYARAGFQVDGHRAEYYQAGGGHPREAALLMSSELEVDNAGA